MDNPSGESRHPAETFGLLVDLGNAADLTLGSGGSGSEDKRKEYN